MKWNQAGESLCHLPQQIKKTDGKPADPGSVEKGRNIRWRQVLIVWLIYWLIPGKWRLVSRAESVGLTMCCRAEVQIHILQQDSRWHLAICWTARQNGSSCYMHITPSLSLEFLCTHIYLNYVWRIFNCCINICIIGIFWTFYTEQLHQHFTSTLQSRPWRVGRVFRVDLIKPVSDVCPYVRLSTKSFFGFNEIWFVARGRWVMHDSMQYDPIQGQGHGQGNEPLKVRNYSIFKRCLLRHLQWVLATDHGFLN